MNIRLLRIIGTTRNFLLKTINREFLVFLFFLALSCVFWLIITLNETFERELTVEVRLTNVPSNYVITNEPEDTLRFTVRDKGYMIAAYLYGQHLRPVYVDFKAYYDGKGHGAVPVSDLQKSVSQQLYGSSKIVAFKTEQLEFFYNKGNHKRVPVKMLGTVTPTSNYYLSHVQFTPDSVTVYATDDMLDSITAAYTERQNITDFAQGHTRQVALRKLRGARFVPGKVSMKLFADVLTEETVTVPIETINVPADKVLRVFPSKVSVRFVVGASRLKTLPKDPVTKALLPNGFRVVVNYEEVASKQADKCRVYVTGTPAGVRSARVETDQLDYVIERR